MSGRRRWSLAAGLCAAVLLLVVAWALRRSAPAQVPPAEAIPSPRPSPPSTLAQAWRKAPRAPSPAPRPAAFSKTVDRAGAEARLERAEEKLERYRESTQYPPGSRPASEEPDRMHLHAPAERTQPLGDDPSTSITVGQDRTFLTADETARLWVRCQTEAGEPVPCRVTSAQVSVLESDGTARGAHPVPISFHDDGQAGDAAADDGTSTALFRPKTVGLGDVTGTLRVDLSVTDDREVAHPFFTLVSTGGAPATFTGEVSDAVVNGSLGFAVGIEVKTEGHYVIHGRVDDANGQPLAWVEFDDALTAGRHAVPLVVFGKLVRDQHPVFPLTLRDVDGFLLLADAYPDRRIVPALEGPVHRTAVYPEARFSDAEWTSEQRTRYLARYAQDVERAQGELDGHAP